MKWRVEKDDELPLPPSCHIPVALCIADHAKAPIPDDVIDSLESSISGLTLANQLKSTQLKEALLGDGDGKALLRHWIHKRTVSTLEAFKEILAGCPYDSSERFIRFTYKGSAWSYTRFPASNPWRTLADRKTPVALSTTDHPMSSAKQSKTANPRFQTLYSRNLRLSPKSSRRRPSLYSFVHESPKSPNYTIVPAQHSPTHPSSRKQLRERAVAQRVFDKLFSGRSTEAASVGRPNDLIRHSSDICKPAAQSALV